MIRIKKYFFYLSCTALYILLPWSNKCNAQGKCLIVSDIHYNPDRQYTLQPGHDSNYQLLEQSIKAMQQALPNPAFIVIAGDFIWHGDHVSKITPETKKEIITTIAGLFQQYFPHVPVISALGNNDTYQKDYDMQDSGFLDIFADAWEKGGSKVFDDNFRQNGYYVYTAKDKFPNLKFVVLNTSLLDNGSRKKGYSGKADTMLNWLDNSLLDAKNKNEKIWIISHIPPGTNTYESLRHQQDTMMWDNGYARRYINLVVKYAPQIQFNIASHTHFNDFRVFCNASGVPVSYLRIMPSISPSHYNNPSFEVADFDTAYHVTKETTYYLDMKSLPAADAARLVWQQGYNISTIGLKEISPFGMLDFINSHSLPQSEVPNGYIRFYNVGVSPKEGGANCDKDTYSQYLKTSVLKADQ